MSDQKALIEEIERNPKAFVVQTDAIDAEADQDRAKAEEYAEKALAKKAEAEARKWALAEWLDDKWNPHNEESRPPRTPKDGISQPKLAELVGWTHRNTVKDYIKVWRNRQSGLITPGTSFADAFLVAKGNTRESSREQQRASWWRQFTDEEKAAKLTDKVRQASEILESMDPEVRDTALEAATPEVRKVLAPTPEPEPEPDPPATPSFSDDELAATAAYLEPLAKKAEERRAQERADHPGERMGEIEGALMGAQRSLGKAARVIEESPDLGKKRRAYIEALLERIKTAVTLVEVTLDHGMPQDQFEAELARLLEGTEDGDRS